MSKESLGISLVRKLDRNLGKLADSLIIEGESMIFEPRAGGTQRRFGRWAIEKGLRFKMESISTEEEFNLYLRQDERIQRRTIKGT